MVRKNLETFFNNFISKQVIDLDLMLDQTLTFKLHLVNLLSINRFKHLFYKLLRQIVINSSVLSKLS